MGFIGRARILSFRPHIVLDTGDDCLNHLKLFIVHAVDDGFELIGENVFRVEVDAVDDTVDGALGIACLGDIMQPDRQHGIGEREVTVYIDGHGALQCYGVILVDEQSAIGVPVFIAITVFPA
jgi:hypothetical protein